METVNIDGQLVLRVNDGPTLNAYLEEAFGVNISKSESGGVTIVDLTSKQIWKPKKHSLVEYGTGEE